MWVAEFKVWHEDSIVLELVKKFGVRVTAYYLSAWERSRGGLGVTKVFLVKGARRKEFIKEFVERKEIDVRFVHGDQVFYAIQDPADSYHSLLFDENVFLTKPILIKDGFEYWSVASWDKKALLRLATKARKMRKKSFVKLLRLREKGVELLLPTSLERLSAKQLQVFLAAVNAGYYAYPRGATLEEIAERAGKKPSTVREHLRRAEAKIMAGVAHQISAFSHGART